MRLLVARHAPVEAAGLCYGRREVRVKIHPVAAAERLARTIPERRPWLMTWSSPSSRCLEPALRLAERLGCRHQLDERLHELSFGEWEGRSWVSIEKEDAGRYVPWMERWQVSAAPGGEAPSELVARVSDWWRSLPRDVDHLLVAHAGVIRALRVVAADLSWEAAMKTEAPHLEWIELPTLRLEPWTASR